MFNVRLAVVHPHGVDRGDMVIELNDALEALAKENARAVQVVEMKCFGGLSGEEIAEQIGMSLRTVNNDWRFAKAWLYHTLNSDQ